MLRTRLWMGTILIALTVGALLVDQHWRAVSPCLLALVLLLANVSCYELLQLLHDQGVLNMLRGLVGGGDALIGTIATAVNTPESIRAIRNFVLLTKFFGNIPPDVLNSLADTVNAGAKREKSHKAPGLLHLLWRLRNKDSRHAVAVALDLLEGVGKGL